MKNSDLRNVLSSLIDLAESGDVRGTSFGSRAAGPLLGLLAHNVSKAAKATPAVETPAVETPAVETPAVETPAVEIVASASAPAEATPATARKSRVTSASA
jgi:hypothetical protein